MVIFVLMLLFGYDPQVVAFTFDDGPTHQSGTISKIMGSRKCTFFILGNKAARRGKMLIAISHHELGNHGWSHTVLRKLKPERMVEELIKTDKFVNSKLYRPPDGIPSGRWNLGDYGYQEVLWDIDSADIEIRRRFGEEKGLNILKRRLSWLLLSQKRSGVILMHEFGFDVKALKWVIGQMTEATFVTTSEWLAYKRLPLWAKPFALLYFRLR